MRRLRSYGGSLFYYADEKPLGTPKQTVLDVVVRETAAMRETLNRLSRHAESQQHNILVMIDQINEKTRAERLPTMYSHILGRASAFPEMRRVIEPPMHIDSELSANIQFADWIAACVGRAIDYQLIENSRYRWVTEHRWLSHLFGSFTKESKLHLAHRAVSDLHHSDLFQHTRPLYPNVGGQRIGTAVGADAARRMHAAAVKAGLPRLSHPCRL